MEKTTIRVRKRRSKGSIFNTDNIFLEGFKVNYYTNVSEKKFNTIDGIEVSGDAVTGLTGDKLTQVKYRDLEIDNFIVEYNSYDGTDLSVVIDGLSDGAFRLYDYLKRNTGKKKLYVFIDKYEYMKRKGITSITTWLKYEGELIRYGIFDRIEGEGGWYWINPRYYYVGYRITGLEKYKKQYEKVIKKDIE